MGSSPSEIQPGDLLGRYELLLPVAKGGMGQVWAARLHSTHAFQKIVAIKMILASHEDEQQLESMLLSEAALASRIKHPNVVEGLDLGEHEGTLYFVMEWVAGESLNAVMQSAAHEGGIPLPITAQIIAEACKGLSAAHEVCDDAGQPLGLVHRDISPQNLLISYSGVTKLTDFGVAKATQRVTEMSVIGQVKGKFAYMSPEQVRGGPIDGRSDIFAMGIVLYRMLARRHPFKGQTPAETLVRILSDEPPPPPSTFARGIWPEMDAIVMRALAHDRDARFRSAREMQFALERAIDASQPHREGDLQAFMHRLFHAQAAERARALRQAVEIADAAAKAGSVGRPARAPFNSTTRALGGSADAIHHAEARPIEATRSEISSDAGQGALDAAERKRREARRRRRSGVARAGAALVLFGAAALSFVGFHRTLSPSPTVETGAPEADTPMNLCGEPSTLPAKEGLAADPDSWLVPQPAPSDTFSASAQPASSTTKSRNTLDRRPVHPRGAGPLPRDKQVVTSGAETPPRSGGQAGHGEDLTNGAPSASSRRQDWDPLSARK